MKPTTRAVQPRRVRLDQAPVATEVIDRAQIETAGARTVKDILRSVPGIERTSIHDGSGGRHRCNPTSP